MHNHSEFSILDGLSPIQALVQRAAEYEQPAIALTDHGNLYGAVDFYLAARNAGVKPIIGVEGYMAHNTIATRAESERTPHHITVLAQNDDGYRNLIKLMTVAHCEGWYYRPRFDWELLSRHADGLIILSGCLSGELQKHLKAGDSASAEQTAQKFKDLLGDRYYLEVMRHEGVRDLERVNAAMVELGRKLDIPLVATNDSHYLDRDHAAAHDTLLCIQTNARLNDEKRMKFDGETFYLRPSSEMREVWRDLPEAADNTLVIAERIETPNIIPDEPLLPRFPTPSGESSIQYLKTLCDEGLKTRYAEPTDEIRSRLEYELSVVEQTGFADYFLVCWDIFKFVNSRKILSAVRGSAAASLILYLLEVTEIDPLEYRLIFERFLNLERREMPDIDMDFADNRRGEVINYCAQKYGAEHVAQIITFSKLGPRAAVHDTARVMGLHASQGAEITKTIPERLHIDLKSALEESSELRDLLDKNQTYKQVFERARRIEGATRHFSTHAAGIVISEKPLDQSTPLQPSTSSAEGAPPTTQYHMNAVAEIGLLKMDFLGLRNLAVIDSAAELARQRGYPDFDIHKISLSDKKTFDMLSAGDTYGVFQLESEGMQRYIAELKPNSVADIAAMIALYRPGPMEHIGAFIESKHGKRAINYPHPHLEAILKETYGVIVYQDQILLIAQQFGDYTLGRADTLRKAMGKKKPEVMKEERSRFVAGAERRGYDATIANRLFDLIEPFAGYAFNKAHSVSYALIAYWTAYMKVNHTLEYFVSLLRSYSTDAYRIGECAREARKQGLEVVTPDINRSQQNFSIAKMDDGKETIIFGLGNIKHVGALAVQDIVDERAKNGRFESAEDFCDRVDATHISTPALNGLTLSGALDYFGPRHQLHQNAQGMLNRLKTSTEQRKSGQTAMDDLFGETVQTPKPPIASADATATKGRDLRADFIRWESQTLGIVVSRAALKYAADMGDRQGLLPNIRAAREGSLFEARGVITERRVSRTRGGEPFLVCKLQLVDGELDLVIWTELFKQTENLWEVGKSARVSGRTQKWKNTVRLNVASVTDDAAPQATNGVASNGAGERTASQSNSAATVPASEQAPTTPKPTAAALGGASAVADKPLNANSAPAETADLNGAETNGASALNGDARLIGVSPSSKLVLRVRDDYDYHQVQTILKKMLTYHGDHPVVMEVAGQKRITRLALPSDFNVHICDELYQQLSADADIDSVKIEP